MTTRQNPTADDLLDLMDRECLWVNVNDNERDATVCSSSHDPWHAESLRVALTQAYHELNAQPEQS
jgi:hypothetical protein